ncbi:MAG TPA: HDOD domain-containing protein [Cellvibrionaceae bacterium]
MKDQAQQLLRVMHRDIEANRLILPSLPEVAMRVRQLTADPDCKSVTLAHEVAKDAAIAARLVKVANSTALLRGKPVTSLTQAVTNLGFNLVRSLDTQLAILQTMQSRGDTERMRGFVAGGLRISALCHTLAGYHPHLEPEQAALGGLLHDMGKLPLRDFLEGRAELSPEQRSKLEQLLHPNVGAMMLRRWQLADTLIQMAREHERILRDSGKDQADYVDVVIAANILHYGTESGRYAKFMNQRIPAVEKCIRGRPEEQVVNTTAERMELAMAMIEAN